MPAFLNSPASVPRPPAWCLFRPLSRWARRVTASSYCQKLRDLADGLKAKTGVWRHLFHRGLQRLGIGQHFRLHLRGVGRGQVAEFVAEFGVARHHVVGNAAVELADAGGGKGTSKPSKRGSCCSKPSAMSRTRPTTQAAISIALTECGVNEECASLPRTQRFSGTPLVGNGGHHERGLTHQCRPVVDAGVAQVGNQLFHAKQPTSSS